MKKAYIFDYLRDLLRRSPSRTIGDDDRIVVFSDLHMGNGGSNDDFLGNADLFSSAVSRYYGPNGYSLVLNGDIEDLQKFPGRSIGKAWEGVRRLFDRFRNEGRLVRIWGNHDEPFQLKPDSVRGTAIEAFRLNYKGNTIFLFHGHQASSAFARYNKYLGILVRYLTRPLGVMNDSVAHDSRRKYKIEKRVYKFSSSEKILSVIGHTHRPLFESLSKVDALKFRIEELCRSYPEQGEEEKIAIASEIEGIKSELRRLLARDGKDVLPGSLYERHFAIPCIFNSGCVTGKRGMTCIEIADGMIRLVHWFDFAVSDRYREAEDLPGTSYRRAVIKEDTLDYIFTRISLLA